MFSVVLIVVKYFEGGFRGLAKEVCCSNCTSIIRTGLKEWEEFSLINQIGIAISEMIAPSRFGKVFYSFLFYNLVIIAIGFFVVLLLLPIGLFAVSESSFFGCQSWSVDLSYG